jgi:hypothetical protein
MYGTCLSHVRGCTHAADSCPTIRGTDVLRVVTHAADSRPTIRGTDVPRVVTHAADSHPTIRGVYVPPTIRGVRSLRVLRVHLETQFR